MDIDPQDLGFARMVIGATTRRLRTNGTLTTDESTDFAAELMARLLTAWESYDPDRGAREAFINSVVSNASTSLLRERSAQKRQGRMVPLGPVAEFHVDRSEAVSRAQDHADLRIDIEVALRVLTPGERTIVDMLRRDTVVSVAKELGIPRRTLRDIISRIARLLEDEGLEKYMR
ncbi:MAG: sigma-70 family RNA polymerase sigma factor [Phycisphaerales bacterium]